MKPSLNRLKRFVEYRLLEALGCPERKFSLKKTGLGIHNQVFYLDIDKMIPLVLKGIKKRQRFSELLKCSEHLMGKGINVPEILHAQEDGRLFKRLGLHIICEKRIMGNTLQAGNYSNKIIAEVSRVLSHMHSFKRVTWGKIDEAKSDGLFEYLHSKINKKLQNWGETDTFFPKKQSEDIFRWIKPWKRNIEEIKTFSLSHCDANPGNFILSNDNQIYLLDTGNIRYLPRAIDYYTLQVQLCEDNRDKIRIFEDTYFEIMNSDDIKEFKKSHLFFKVYVLVNFACMLAERIKRDNTGDPFHKQLPEYLTKAKKVIFEIIS